MQSKEERNAKALERYHDNREKNLKYAKEYRDKNKKRKAEYNKEWRNNNRLRCLYHSNLYKISGYTFEEFETHLLNTGWKPGLHIDHKIPIVHFSPNTPIRLINDLRNIHPVNIDENLSKGSRYQDIVDKEYYNEIQKYLII
jgi:hypothetical protein